MHNQVYLSIVFWHLYVVANIDFNSIRFFFLVTLIGLWKYQPDGIKLQIAENQFEANSFHWRSRAPSDLSGIYVQTLFLHRNSLVFAQHSFHLS